MPAFGEYAAIEVLGGANYALWGSNIVSTYLVASNYALGAALTIIGIMAFLLTTACCISIYSFIKFFINYKPEKNSLHSNTYGEE